MNFTDLLSSLRPINLEELHYGLNATFCLSTLRLRPIAELWQGPYSHPASIFGNLTPSVLPPDILYVADLPWVFQPHHTQSPTSILLHEHVHNVRYTSIRFAMLFGKETRHLWLIPPPLLLLCFNHLMHRCLLFLVLHIMGSIQMAFYSYSLPLPIEKYRQLARVQKRSNSSRFYVEPTLYDQLIYLRREYQRMCLSGSNPNQRLVAYSYFCLKQVSNTFICLISISHRLAAEAIEALRKIDNFYRPS